MTELNNIAPLLLGCTIWISLTYFLIKTACFDPGVIPYQLDDQHIYAHRTRFQNWKILDGLQGQTTHLIQMKYCRTCQIFRPKRTIHCKECDVCIEQLDHHCPFISTCVGRRNYVHFFFFCILLWINSIFSFVLTVIDIVRRIHKYEITSQHNLEFSWKMTMREMPLSIPLSLLSGITLILISALLTFHMKMNVNNQTTFEHSKKTFSHFIVNPFSAGSWIDNLKISIFIKKPLNPVYRPRELAFDKDGYRKDQFKNN